MARTKRTTRKKIAETVPEEVLQEQEDLEKEEEVKEEPETYPNPQVEKQVLHQRAEEYLEKVKEKEEPLLKQQEEEDKIEEEEQTEEDQLEGSNDETPKAMVVQNTSPINNKEEKKKSFQIIFLPFFSGVLAALLIGMVLGNAFSSSPKNDPQSTVDKNIQKDLALHNVIPKDEIYHTIFEVIQMDERVDGIYVTFKMTNKGEYPIYFMAPSIKLIGQDGQIYLPELGKGDIPTTFTGGGISADLTDEATLVFKLPKEVKPAYFLLENVTNLHNGSWSYKVNVN